MFIPVQYVNHLHILHKTFKKIVKSMRKQFYIDAVLCLLSFLIVLLISILIKRYYYTLPNILIQITILIILLIILYIIIFLYRIYIHNLTPTEIANLLVNLYSEWVQKILQTQKEYHNLCILEDQHTNLEYLFFYKPFLNLWQYFILYNTINALYIKISQIVKDLIIQHQI